MPDFAGTVLVVSGANGAVMLDSEAIHINGGLCLQ
jgi:hypothetical protein